MLLLHNCLFGLNVFTELGTKLLFPYFQFQKVLKSLIKSIGKDPDEYSSHSFRRGAFSAEVPSELIQLYRDWSSDAYKKYLRFKLDDKIAVAEKIEGNQDY
jgi:hypothetical protein